MKNVHSEEEKLKNIQWICSSENNIQLAERYDSLAEQWDETTDGYITPIKTVEKIVQYIKLNARVLDAGCGTGAVGELLTQQNYACIEGFDLSAGMLKKAQQKNCYAALSQQELGKPLQFSTDYFDAVILSGVFLKAHAPSSSFDELIRITKQNGYIIFTLRSELFHDGGDFKSKVSILEKENKWVLVESDDFCPAPKINIDARVKIFVYQKNS